MNIKIQKSPFHSNLTGAALFALGVLESKLTNAISQAVGKSTWTVAQESIGAAVQGMDTEHAIAACDKFKADALEALYSREVSEELDKAGFGDLAGIQNDEAGRQKALGKDAKYIAARYGAKFRLKAQLDRASNTIKQYCDNIRAALSLGVEWKGKTVQQVIRANRDATEALDPARLKARQAEETARNVGQSMTDAYKKGDEAFQGVVHMFNAIMDGWKHATPEQREMAILAIGEQAEVFQAAKDEHDAATVAAEGNDVSDSSSAANLPNVESSDENVHAGNDEAEHVEDDVAAAVNA